MAKVDIAAEMLKAAKSAFVYYTEERPEARAEAFAEVEAVINRRFGSTRESEGHQHSQQYREYVKSESEESTAAAFQDNVRKTARRLGKFLMDRVHVSSHPENCSFILDQACINEVVNAAGGGAGVRSSVLDHVYLIFGLGYFQRFCDGGSREIIVHTQKSSEISLDAFIRGSLRIEAADLRKALAAEA